MHLRGAGRVLLAVLLAPMLAAEADLPFFSYPSGKQLEQQVAALGAGGGRFAAVRSAEDMYGEPAARSAGVTCSPQVVTVTDGPSAGGDFLRPQVYISGEIHGNEKVGPLAALHTARLLSWAAACEVSADGPACAALAVYGLSAAQRVWLAVLATRRETIITPITNCLGYHLGRRDDNGVDPNRDFPYTRRDQTCFMSTTARVINGVLRHSMAQMVVTFHGGMAAIGYEWGSYNHMRPLDKSPDDHMNKDVAGVMSKFGGAFRRERAYRIGNINSLVYPVYGGMEDWIYASGWDPAGLQSACRGLPAARQAAQAQAAVFLVETSDSKAPPGPELGCAGALLADAALPALPAAREGVSRRAAQAPPTGESRCNGHVPRNIRLALSAVDLVQPYVCLSGLRAETGQLRGAGGGGTGRLRLSWYVGGGLHVNATWVSLHRSPLHRPGLRHDGAADVKYLRQHGANGTHLLSLLRPSAPTERRRLQEGGHSASASVWDSPALSGQTVWSVDTARVSADAAEFYSTVHIPSRLESKHMSAKDWASSAAGEPAEVTHVYWLVVWAAVDVRWGQPPGDGQPRGLEPQSFLSRARGAPGWRAAQRAQDMGAFEAPGRLPREIRGRRFWPSDPAVVAATYRGPGQAGAAAELVGAEVLSTVHSCAWWTR